MTSSLYKQQPARTRSGLLRPIVCAVLCFFAAIAAGCSPPPDTSGRRFTEILNLYPNAQEPLHIKKLTTASAAEVAPALHGKAVTVMVHPAYSLFFRDANRSTYTEAKFDLLKFQLDSEARFISEIARTDNLLILVLPGNFLKESIAPLSYTYYLNAAAGDGTSVYYITTESWSSGALSTGTLVTLYGFLQKIGANRMLVGGGYIGRCQQEFFIQVSAYVDKVKAYIVPEISSISPDDITDRESADILASIQKGDYTRVKQFIEHKSQGAAEVVPLPAEPGI